MEIYLVGGAVRDKLLGLPPRERDWVVVGALPQQLITLGYRQVGKDFPVFLHPETKEEYALARTERKSGPGHTDFQCDFSPSVTLEEDLKRRDLTVNAMALKESGELVDPWGGQQDLSDRVLRHVSEAFVEDPLRVLRVARFAARYQTLGFQVAPETLSLMKHIVETNELAHLVPERVWKEIRGAISEPAPDEFVRVLRACDALAEILPEVDCLFGVPQTKKYHPEIDTGEHLLLAMQMAARLSKDPETRFAVLVHDLGKGVTPKDQWPSHRGHESAGVPIIEDLAKRLKIPNLYAELAKIVSLYHLHCHRALQLRGARILDLFQATDAYRRTERFEKFLLACEADARGRAGLTEQPYPQAEWLRRCFKKVAKVKPQQPGKSSTGEQIATELKQARLNLLKQLIAQERQNDNPH